MSEHNLHFEKNNPGETKKKSDLDNLLKACLYDIWIEVPFSYYIFLPYFIEHSFCIFFILQ